MIKSYKLIIKLNMYGQRMQGGFGGGSGFMQPQGSPVINLSGGGMGGGMGGMSMGMGVNVNVGFGGGMNNMGGNMGMGGNMMGGNMMGGNMMGGNMMGGNMMGNNMGNNMMGGNMGMGGNMMGNNMGGGMGNGGMRINNGGSGFNFNRWGQDNNNYQNMNGFCNVDYSNGWNPSVHDNMLQNVINSAFNNHDYDRSGQLQGMEFFNAYKQICLRMGMAPPNDYQSLLQVAQTCDTNFDGRINRMEILMMFKRIQGINAGYGF